MSKNRFIAALCMALFAASAWAGDLALSNAWIRYLPGGVPAGGYFTLTNDGAQPVTLTGAESSAFGMVMMHRSEEKNGVSRMLPVGEIRIPPGGKVEFKPGGYHLMLMQPAGKIAPGEKIPLTLEFAGGQKLSGEFAVRGPAGK